ncbi:MAG: UDP-N-acetylmuramate--L-alanine ligase [bacterium]|nr:UDP-N-acetylmuramate--L-alanine ligase [bacterium]
MYKIDFKHPCHIYFMGIGGISMSGFAELLHSAGFTISGSDAKESNITKHLETMGISILYGQRAQNITKNIDLVVYTAAISKNNPEFMAAEELGIPMMPRAEMVGQVMTNYETPIAIAGTHGKTTTTSMVSHIFLAGEKDPTISVGGILKAINGNLRIGKSSNFITEACEYTNSFLHFNPKISVILNIEEDHMDFFKDINDIRASFKEFAHRLPEDGTLIINGEIDQYEEITSDLTCNVITYGFDKEKDFFAADNIEYDENGYGCYDLYVNGEFKHRMHLSVVGRHNISNSLAALAVGYITKIPFAVAEQGLQEFCGTDRRFQYKGKIGELTIIDDYAHHPTEIKATLEAARRYPAKSIWVVFQPHTYTRTKAFLPEFSDALSAADHIILTDIYAAREVNPGDISSKDILNLLQEKGKDAYYFPSFDEIENIILEKCGNGDLLITMGAGDVVSIGESLLGK